MKLGSLKFSAEPALWVGFLQAVIAVVVLLGVDVSEELQAAILVLVSAGFALVVRQNVTPT